MRLIDADNINFHCNYDGDCTGDIDDCKECENYICDFRDIQEQPTAYNPDKVVEEIIEEAHNTIVDFKLDKYVYTCKAIEIVKQGCVETETETIRDKAVKWNNNSSKRVPYEFIDYVEGKRDIGVSDDVCEWKYKHPFGDFPSCKNVNSISRDRNWKFCPYCGKKIKAVE